jgi:hypothetical protein
MECSEVNSKQLKLTSATLGAGAVLAIGGLTVAINDVSAAGPEHFPAGPEITIGETATETTAPDAPETSVAVPPITTPPFTIPTGEPQ